MKCHLCGSKANRLKFELGKFVCFSCLEDDKPKPPMLVFKGRGWATKPRSNGTVNFHH